MFTGVRKIFVHPDGRPMIFYIPPSATIANIDKDRILELVSKGGGAFTTQPGSPPQVFTLLNSQADADLPEGESAVDQSFIEYCSERGCLHDWRQFLIGLPEKPAVRSEPTARAPTSLQAPSPTQVPMMSKLVSTKKHVANGQTAKNRHQGDLSCLSDPTKHQEMKQPQEPNFCDDAGLGYRQKLNGQLTLRQLLDSQEDFEVSDEEELKANIDMSGYTEDGLPVSYKLKSAKPDDDFQRQLSGSDVDSASQRKASISTDGSIESGSMRGNGYPGKHPKRRNSKEAIALLAGVVESRRQEIAKKEEAEERHHQHHSMIRKIAHAAEWFGAGAFFFAASILLALWARHEYEEAFVTTFFVTSIACSAYVVKATVGDFIINGVKVPLARYVDWLTTTPLMLYELCHLAHAPTHTTMFIIGCDILMLGFGIVSALISWKQVHLKHVWFLASCVFYLLMLICLQIDVAQDSVLHQPETVQELFQHLQVLTAVTWSFYPIVVLLGRAHFKVITRDVEDICLTFLDIIAKIGMEGFIVSSCATGGCKADSYSDGSSSSSSSSSSSGH